MRTDGSSLTLTRLVRHLACISAILWLLCVCSVGWDLLQGHGFPLIRKFFPFEDITIYQTRFKLYHSSAFFQLPHRKPGSPVAFAYPPAAALVYAAFYLFDAPQNIYLVLLVLWTLVLAAGAWLALSRSLGSGGLATRYVLWLSAFCFPLLFLAERANIELFVWIALTVAVWLYHREHHVAAAVVIGCAASVKIYPILLLGLFVAERRAEWRAVAAGLMSAVVTTFVAIWYSGPTFGLALSGFVAGVSKFNEQHAELPRRAEAVFDHSLFSPVKLAYLGTHGSPLQWTTIYFVVAGTVAFAVFWFIVRKLPFVNRLAFLSVAMVLLPPVSYEYTLVHLYVPALLLLLSLARQPQAVGWAHKATLWALGCALCAMMPLGLLAGGTFLHAGVIQLVCLLLFGFFVCVRSNRGSV